MVFLRVFPYAAKYFWIHWNLNIIFLSDVDSLFVHLTAMGKLDDKVLDCSTISTPNTVMGHKLQHMQTCNVYPHTLYTTFKHWFINQTQGLSKLQLEVIKDRQHTSTGLSSRKVCVCVGGGGLSVWRA